MSQNRKPFFDLVRTDLFGGKLVSTQVQGMDIILDMCRRFGANRLETAYILATAYHETGKAMWPVHEQGGDQYLSKYDTGQLALALGNSPEADGDGKRYAGRGFVQLTGRANYRKAGQKIGVDLVASPDRALEPLNSAVILVRGMLEGWFTRYKLKDFRLPDGALNLTQARQAVNGTDKALVIAAYALRFNNALNAMAYTPPPPDIEPVGPTPPAGTSFWATLWNAIVLFFTRSNTGK